jgi:hypothetical protein
MLCELNPLQLLIMPGRPVKLDFGNALEIVQKLESLRATGGFGVSKC